MNSVETDGTYECTLSPALVQKAEQELNEQAEWRKRDIDILREMVTKDKSNYYLYVHLS